MTQQLPERIALTSIIRDFRADHPDFENDQQTLWNRYIDLSLPERGIVQPNLGPDQKPVYRGDAQAGTQTTSGKAAFDQWYRNDSSINRVFSLPLELTLDYTSEGRAQYKFESNSFFPLDGQPSTFGSLHDEIYGNNQLAGVIEKNIRDRTQRLGYIEKGPGEFLTEADIKGRFDSDAAKTHNYHFTQEIVTTFTYQGSEFFEFQGDDDLWVFIDGKLVIDLGGLHAHAKARIDLSLANPKNRAANKGTTLVLKLQEDLDIGHADSSTELMLEVGKEYDIRLFHAERHTFDSNFSVYTSIQLQPTIQVLPPKPPPAPDPLPPVIDLPPLNDPKLWEVGDRIVCVAPVRTIVRREEEITIIRRVRKVEEIDASPTCPVGTTPINTAQMMGIQQDN
ncbi:MAG: fibro-slime domain-containing protein [Cyanothece sp. SIO1E1]|nr:fibro-slime domain-containing protein [Cyanothece sp. SIO1E1]